MEQDVRLGRIAGVPVGVNWSIFLIVALVVWELADLTLPRYVPGKSAVEYWVVGSLTAVLFFASLLLHEVSHAVMARREGVGVRRITLWLFGGVSELEGDAMSPGADFRIAVVGPVLSLVLAAFFGALHWGLQPVVHTSVAAEATGWLAWTNVALGVFNLLPAAPLDGGRVLRAAIWRRSGDRVRAAAASARAGIALGFFLVALGAVDFFAGALFGLWFVFLGWFLVQAARDEETSSVMRAALATVRVRDVMTPDPVTFSSTMTVTELLDSPLEHHHFSTFPLVGADGTLRGLTTMGRVRRVEPARRSATALIEIASPLDEVPVGAPRDEATALLRAMSTSADNRGLVLEAGRLVGVVSPSDVVRFVQLTLVRHEGSPTRRSRGS